MRSESGRYDRAGHGVNIPRASRKDVRDAVAAARKAFGPWSARTAYNRGQILYRAAEALESRRDQLAAVSDAAQVDAAVDVLVHYAGWTDKFQAVLGGINPVAAPVPVVLAARADRRRRGRRARRARSCSASWPRSRPRSPPATPWSRSSPRQQPLAGLDLAEVLGVSDIPGGVVNLLSGRRTELATALGAHRDLNAIVDAGGDAELGAELDRLAAETIKRARHGDAAASYETAVDDALERIEAVTELKTAWHPVGRSGPVGRTRPSRAAPAR